MNFRYNKYTTVIRWSERIRYFLFRKRHEIFFYSSIVDTQKFISACGHVDIVRLPLSTFLIYKRIYRVILRFCLDETVHDLK